jgi:hypothetical protein
VNLPSIARWTGLLVGLSLALVALVQARVPAGTGEVPAFASLKAEPSEKLGVAPVARELLSARRLLPGESVTGRVQVANLTGAPLAVRPRLETAAGDAPASLRIELRAGGRTIYDGSLAGFHPSVRLGVRASRRLRIRIAAPRAHAREIEGRSFALQLRWRTSRAGR